MTFSMYALLGDEAPSITNESLAGELKLYFRGEANFSLEFEALPFASKDTLALRWDDWLVRVAYEEGDNVLQDSVDISNLIGSSAPFDVSAIARRIRLIFSSDEGNEHTNQILYLVDFLRDKRGVVLFDPQQRDLVT